MGVFDFVVLCLDLDCNNVIAFLVAILVVIGHILVTCDSIRNLANFSKKESETEEITHDESIASTTALVSDALDFHQIGLNDSIASESSVTEEPESSFTSQQEANTSKNLTSSFGSQEETNASETAPSSFASQDEADETNTSKKATSSFTPQDGTDASYNATSTSTSQGEEETSENATSHFTSQEPFMKKRGRDICDLIKKLNQNNRAEKKVTLTAHDLIRDFDRSGKGRLGQVGICVACKENPQLDDMLGHKDMHISERLQLIDSGGNGYIEQEVLEKTLSDASRRGDRSEL
jgi:hypothetical protein